MAKVKLTKTALKQERDALKQYQRFLPTLQLKKQQLQMEMRHCQNLIAENEVREQKMKDSLNSWVILFSGKNVCELISQYLSVQAIRTRQMNIAGVEVPVFLGVDFHTREYDIFEEEPWLDDAIAAIKDIVSIQLERDIIREQHRLIAHELRITTQRVNLFEKVKIPEARENIRIINIAIGDADTSAVARSKIAKKKLQETTAA